MKIRAFPLPESVITDGQYDCGLAAIGYESRAKFFFSSFSGSVLKRDACAFEKQRGLHFDDNLKFFQSNGFIVTSTGVDKISGWVATLNGVKPLKTGPLRVVVDISSMTREMIATVCYYLAASFEKSAEGVEVDFIYSIAEFGEIPKSFGPIVSNGPAISQLAGWSQHPRLPCGLILGIGYEEDLALGMIEDLEAGQVWAFRPKDHDSRYDIAIDERNRGLRDEIRSENIIRYSVFDPYSIFVSVEALVGLARNDFRLVIVPFGPKIFSLASCLVSLRHYPEVGFWRVSGGVNQEPVDRKALGKTLGLRVLFGGA